VGGGGIFATADDLDGRPHPTAVSAPVIINNVIAANGGKRGGGITVIDSNGGVPRIANNTLVANNGSGVFWGSSALEGVVTRPVILNNIVAFNTWGLEKAAGTPTNPNIEFNCVYGNTLQGKPGNYRGLEDLTGTQGNISVDPMLAHYRFANTHLQPSSPCIDAGKIPVGVESWQDIDQQSRVAGGGIDIGADESDGTLWETPVRVIHVSPSGNDLSDGRSWNTARKTIAAGIDAAKVVGAKVWVAEGTYREHITVPAFVYIYGGFAGNETNRDQRRISLQPTILDGDGELQIVTSRNAGYLVSAIDGFTVQNGGDYTGGETMTKYGTGGLGGGFYIGVTSPRISNNLIRHNGLAYDNRPVFPQSPSYGAGIYCYLSYADISGNTIRENEILNDFDGSGAGIYCTQSAPLIRGNAFIDNSAVQGSAIYALFSSPMISSNLIESNAMYNTYPFPLFFGSRQGAITLQAPEDFLVEANIIKENVAAVGAGVTVHIPNAGSIRNNLILNNRAYDPTSFSGMGGGIYCLMATNAVTNVYIIQNNIVSNIATGGFTEQGGAVAYTLVPPENRLIIANNLIISNSSGIYQTLTQPMIPPTLLHNNFFQTGTSHINVTAGETDVSFDPLFVNAAAMDFKLKESSPAIDAGSAFVPASKDQEGTPRPLDGNNDGVSLPDIGALEFVHPSADSDGDWMIDTSELLAGTDPTEANSVLKLEAEIVERKIVLRWLSAINRTYRVEFQDTLGATGPEQILVDELTGTGEIMQCEDDLSYASMRYYRVTLLP
jgi:hypothetical protein